MSLAVAGILCVAAVALSVAAVLRSAEAVRIANSARESTDDASQHIDHWKEQADTLEANASDLVEAAHDKTSWFVTSDNCVVLSDEQRGIRFSLIFATTDYSSRFVMEKTATAGSMVLYATNGTSDADPIPHFGFPSFYNDVSGVFRADIGVTAV
jgi:ABC-type protease/lipase transport system fused ATPase/permease subunit